MELFGEVGCKLCVFNGNVFDGTISGGGCMRGETGLGAWNCGGAGIVSILIGVWASGTGCVGGWESDGDFLRGLAFFSLELVDLDSGCWTSVGLNL